MTTATINTTGAMERSQGWRGTRVRVGHISIGFVAFLALLVSAWGAVVPYVGPAFGFGATGGGSWHWSLGHSLLGLAPGGVGVIAGLLVLAETRGITVGRGRISLLATGLLLLLCGAWFVLGPAAWPAIVTTHASYFAAASSPLRGFVNQLGYNLGTGVVVAACGGFTAGWATRHGATETESVPEVPVSGAA